MSEGESNFIKNRRWKLKNSSRFAVWILDTWWGLMFPWMNSVLAEKISFGVIFWVYLCIALFYATNSWMKSRKKRNAYHGWSGYFTSWLMLYIAYRFLFAGFHYLMFIFIAHGILQTALWVLGVVYNIRKNKYVDPDPRHLKQLGINAFTIVSFVSFAGVLVANGCILGFAGIEALKILLISLLLSLHYIFLMLSTFIVQWWIMKKYDYDEIVE